MVRVVIFHVVNMVGLASVGVLGGMVSAERQADGTGIAQPAPNAEQQSLGRAVRARFDVVFLTEGLALSPRDETTQVRLIELREGLIAIDGAEVTGQELRQRLSDPPTADLVIRLSYLEPALRGRLFARSAPETSGTVSDEAEERAGGSTTSFAESTRPPSPPVPLIPPAPPRPEAGGDVEAAPEPRRRAQVIRGDIVRIGGPVTVEVDERVRGDVVVIGGPVTVDGAVDGEVVVVGGRARFGPEAVVDGEVTVVGGRFDRARSAQLHGNINHVGLWDWDLSGVQLGAGSWRDGVPFAWRSGPFRRSWDLAGTVIRLLFYALLASVVVAVATGSVERAAARSAAEPLKAGAVGFLAQLLLGPLLVLGVVVLTISIIGIPLLVLVPFAVLGVFAIMVAGFAGSAHALGRWVRARFGLATHPIYVSVWAGIALLLIPTLVGEAFELVGGPFGILAVLLVLTGVFLEYAAWTTGFGAIILNRFGPASPPAPGSPVSLPPAEPDPTQVAS